ncbi:MAG: RNA methyltransferase, partial [Clostridia bacterium]|nr:RNA methyltransferase [Clostridia bacterium]
MMKEITSPKNKMVCDLKKLKTKKYREQTGLFLAEGYRNVCDSIRKQQPKLVFLEKNFQEFVPLEECTEVYQVTEEVLKELCDTKTPQGIAAVFPIPKEKEMTSPTVLLLNGVSDPGNLGTILRTALAAGFTDIVLDEQCADPFAPKVVRSAMSAIFSLNLIRVKDLSDSIAQLQKKEYRVF